MHLWAEQGNKVLLSICNSPLGEGNPFSAKLKGDEVYRLDRRRNQDMFLSSYPNWSL